MYVWAAYDDPTLREEGWGGGWGDTMITYACAWPEATSLQGPEDSRRHVTR